MGRENLHIPRFDYTNFCKEFNSVVIGEKKRKEKLIACSELCNINLGPTRGSAHATELL